MAGVEVGTAYVTVVPSAKGFASKLQGELGGTMSTAGARAGDSASKGFGTRFSAGVKVAAVAGAAALAGAAAAAIGFGRDAIAEARESQKVGAMTQNVIRATGGAAKVTATQVGDLATAISNKTGIDDEAIQSGANMLLTFKNIRNEAGKGNDIFNQSTQVLTDMATAMGSDPKQAAIQLGKALNDPVKGISALSRVGVTFTAQQKKTIKSLVEGGKSAEAQKIILKELNSEFGGSAAASATAGEKMSTAFGNVKEQVGTALLPVLDKVEGSITTKVLPAASKFIDEFQKGEGAGGRFRDVLANIVDKVKTFITDFKNGEGAAGTFRTTLEKIASVAMSVAKWIGQNSTVVLSLVGAVMAGVTAFKVITGVIRIFTAVQAALNLVLSLNPIGLVIIAVAALVAGIIIAYKKSETFRNVVKGAFEAISAAARFMWNNVVAPVIRFLLNAFDKVTGYYSTMLRALSKVPGFGWAAKAADALDRAGGKARELAANIRDIPDHKTVNVDIYARTRQTGRIEVGGQKVNIGMRAHGGTVTAGQPYIVGERRPELFVPSENGRIVPRVPDGGAGVSVTINGNVGWQPDEVANRIDARRRDAAALYNLQGV